MKIRLRVRSRATGEVLEATSDTRDAVLHVAGVVVAWTAYEIVGNVEVQRA